MTRADARAAFLAQNAIQASQLQALPQDASPRAYHRFQTSQGPRILMDVPPESGLHISSFCKIDGWLLDQGLSAPNIYASDPASGFAVLEDFGDDLFAHRLATTPKDEAMLYQNAVDVLVHVHKCAPPDLPLYDHAFALFEASLVFSWYTDGPSTAQQDLAGHLTHAFAQIAPATPSVVLRDYHAENLFWLPNRQGVARVGLIDFQDARIGHPAYDLASLLGDARRDVAPQTRKSALAHYAANSRTDMADLSASVALWSAQRNLKILGLFARLARRDGKLKYLELLPRVWNILMQDLDHPILHSLKAFVVKTVPAPTPSIITALGAYKP